MAAIEGSAALPASSEVPVSIADGQEDQSWDCHFAEDGDDGSFFKGAVRVHPQSAEALHNVGDYATGEAVDWTAASAASTAAAEAAAAASAVAAATAAAIASSFAATAAAAAAVAAAVPLCFALLKDPAA
jgi:hypothetical protein